MTTTLLPELTKDTAEAMLRALDRRHNGLTPREIGDAVVFSVALRDLLRHSREGLRGLLSNGIEVKAFASECRQARSAVDVCLSLLRRLNGETVSEELTGAAAEVEDFRSTIDRWLTSATAPLPPIDAIDLERNRQACVRGECEDIESILSRLQAGDEG